MTPRSLPLAVRAALLLATLLVAALGCQENPPEPAYDNPFDPAGPYGGDPLDVRANFLDSIIVVLWNHQEGFGIDAYNLEHSDRAQGGWEDLALDLPTNQTSFTHRGFAPNALHRYRVQALTADGRYTLTSYAVAGEVTTPPLAFPSPPGADRPSRYLDLKVVVGRGDQVRLADNADFTGALEFPAPAAGETLVVAWDLGEQPPDGEPSVHLQSYAADYTSATGRLDFNVDFAPELGFSDPSGTGRTASRDVELTVPVTGVLSMRFADTQAGLDAAAPVAPAPTHPYQLADVAQPQTVWGRFDGDFGFSADVSLELVPDLLDDVEYGLVLPANGVISVPSVTVAARAAATEMRIHDAPDFTGVAWGAYADTSSFAFTPVAGQRVIYAQFRNDWTTSAVLVDTLEYVLQPLSILFSAPADGEWIAGGRTYTVTGRAVAADGATLTAVELDTGDGNGFTSVPTGEYWLRNWDVPRFRATTELTLRARASTAQETATTAVTVTVVQLAVAVDDPLPGDTLDADTDVTLAGTATAPLGGAVDSVTVDVGGEHFLADGTLAWTVDWRTPDVAGATPATITAAAWAAGDSVRTVVDVTVAPPAR